jgi:paired amphipathic helix protein Sin3a
MLSHVRGEASYVAGIQSLQVHTPRPEAKMPPIGNFAPPSSVGKDNKKRRGGAGSQITIGGSAAAGQDLSSVSGQGGRNNGISGNAPKVCS